MPQFMGNDSLYELDEPSMPEHGHLSIVSLAIWSITFLLGLPGNGLVIWIVTLKMKQTVNTTWFLHLAVADFVCCLSLPFSIVHMAIREYWPYGWFFCKIIPSAIVLNMFASVFLLTAISIDRCLVVMKPIWCQNFRTVRIASVTCGIIWLLAFIMCSPVFFYRETSVDELGNTKCGYNWYGNEYEDNKWPDDHFAISDSDMFSTQHPTLMPSGSDEDITSNGTLEKGQILVLPSISVSMSTTAKSQVSHSSEPDSLGISPGTQLNSTISNSLHSDDLDFFASGSYSGNFSAGNDSMTMYYYDYPFDSQPSIVLVYITITRSIFGFLLPLGTMAVCYVLITHKIFTNQFAKPRRKTLHLILLVIAIFFLCWAPYHVVGVFYLVASPGTKSYEMLDLWDHIATALAYANSCINPLLYVFVGQSYRQKARQTVQGVFERAFSEEVTCSTAYSRDRSKSTDYRAVDSSQL
ncbi:C3a anaphylatoxin chemotactic receptor [Hemicordylus capensis]|uniref:C3a anaphylatoxin chemotactic receptor n=1 Tax=Hemicordylus capensis TaxID=884348 RepID=UPI0023032BF7|nr:C3a anaphylatoxin chemotactic receptor [Hemicordylus capensis]XP_053107800.1 C3a anaphylatoxin chemotactic receptor [Hemicordylus capensis]XP_053107801.1 C3a anaphylatoxin chemotactic receptor [Hemicordylus capensis]